MTLSTMRKVYHSGVVNYFDSIAALIITFLSLVFLAGDIGLNSLSGLVALSVFFLVFFIGIVIENKFSIRLIKYSPAVFLFFIATFLFESTTLNTAIMYSEVVLALAISVPFFFQLLLTVDRVAGNQKLFFGGYALYSLLIVAFVLFMVTLLEWFYWLTLIALIGLYSLMISSVAMTKNISRHEKLKASFVVYMSAPPESGYQLKMWLPYLNKISSSYYIVVREKHLVLELSKFFPDNRVVYVASLEQLDTLLAEDVKAVFYVNNACKNAHMVRYRKAKHILLLHGDSEKAASYNPMSAMYDYLYVAGQAAIERYKVHGIAIPDDKFIRIGRPQLYDLKEIRESEYNNKSQKTVLYAPTWEGISQSANHSSLPVAEKLIRLLLDKGYKVIFRPHPLSAKQNRVKSIVRSVQSTHIGEGNSNFVFSNPLAEGSSSIHEDMNQSDILVSDNSSVINDYLVTTKPFVVIDIQNDFVNSQMQHHISSAAYVVEEDISNLNEVLALIESDDPLESEREVVKAFYLDQCTNHNGQLKLIAEVQSVIEGDKTK